MEDSPYRGFYEKLIDLYVYGSFHIGLCASMFTVFGFKIFGGELDFKYLYCIFFSTISLYSLHRYIGINKVTKFANEGRFRIIKLYKFHILFYFIVAGLVSIFFFLLFSFKLQLCLLVLGSISVGYTLPFLKGKRLRDLHYIKIFLIAFVWSCLCIGIPGILKDGSIKSIIVYSLASGFYFIGITLPFDIRDVEVDQSINVKTLAQRLGVVRSLNLSKYMILLSMIVAGIYGLSVGQDIITISWIVTGAVSIYCITKYDDRLGDWYYSLLLDGMIGMFLIAYQITYLVIN